MQRNKDRAGLSFDLETNLLIMDDNRIETLGKDDGKSLDYKKIETDYFGIEEVDSESEDGAKEEHKESGP